MLILFHRPEHIHPAHPRQHHIQQNQVYILAVHDLQRIFPAISFN